MSTLFIIDIGSNSVRLAKIVNGKTIYKQKENTRLAKGLSAGGILQSAATSLTLSVVEKFANIAREEGYEPRVFATAAVRNANNGSDFVASIKRTLSLSVDVISGETEAYLGFLGVFPAAESIFENENLKNFTVIDIGGASTEVVNGCKKGIEYSASIDIGIVALKEASIKACGAVITQQCIDNAIEKLLPNDAIDIEKLSGPVFAIGGTAACIAAIDLKLEVYDVTKVHCHRMTIGRLAEIVEMLMNLSIEEIKTIPGVEEGRADVIQGGVRLLQTILNIIGANEFIVSESDNIEGYAKHKKLI